MTGLTVNELAIDNGVGYSITGNAITLGDGGIAASPSANDGIAELSLPITLGAPQTWSIEGELLLSGNVSGASDALGIDFASISDFPFLDLYESNAEVGAVMLKGEGSVVVGKSLNGTDGNSVTMSEGAGLYSLLGHAVTVGPLTTTEDNGVVVGQIFEGGAGTLAANGGVTLDSTSTLYTYINQPGTVAGTDFSQLSATGAVNLGSAHLSLSDGEFGSTPSCEALTPGDVDTLVTTTGSLTGTFTGIPDGTTVPVHCLGSGTSPTARINYTAHAATATILTAGVAGPSIPTATAVEVSSAAPAVGEAVTYTATVTPDSGKTEPVGSVKFLDGGQPIAECSAQPLAQGPSSSTAACTLSYPAAGSHDITASYTSQGHYGGSSSAIQVVNVHESSAGGGGNPPSGGGPSPAPAPVPSPIAHKKPFKCKKGFKKAKKHGKTVCVKPKEKHKRG